MRNIVICILLVLSYSADCQVYDTVHVYDGLDIMYLRHGDTVSVSVRKWDDIVSIMRSLNRSDSYWQEAAYWSERALSYQDSMYREMEKTAYIWKDRSVMYRDMYQHTVDDVHKLHGMVKDCVEIGRDERRRGRVQGIVWGSVGGVIIGIVTAAILLK